MAGSMYTVRLTEREIRILRELFPNDNVEEAIVKAIRTLHGLKYGR